MLKQDDYFNELKKIGDRQKAQGVYDAMTKLFDTVKASADQATHDVIKKAKLLLRLIRSNIIAVGSSKNFDVDDMQNDVTTMQDVIFRIESINIYTKDQLKLMNSLHKKHLKIKQIVNE